MILIFSILDDPATSETIRWLHHLGADRVVRLNANEKSKSRPRLFIDDRTFELQIDDAVVRLDEVQAVWYRKGSFWFDGLFDTVDLAGHEGLSANLNAKFASESARVRDYFHYLIAKNVRTLGHADIGGLNKLITLDHARQVGLAVPEFFVSNRRERFEAKLQQGARLITKATSNGVYLWDFDSSQNAYFSYTERLTLESLQGMPAVLSPSFAQVEISKRLELRVFFLDGDVYPIAIFSQADEKTKVDYRKYNYERPNRTVPYVLPGEIEEKIVALFGRLGLNTGSLDMMMDEDGTYYFLEINPAGQFDGLSNVCNFQLSKQVALWLKGDHGS